MKTKLSNSISLTLALLGAAATVNAAAVNGILWSVPAATADNVPTLGNTPGPGATEWGTFNASALDFSGDAYGNYNLGGFLNSFGAASNIVYMNGASATSSLTNVLFEFTGTALFTNGAKFTVLHDDGVNLYVNGTLVLGVPIPTSPTTTPYSYNGPTGNYNFDFIYANGPAYEADFQTTLVTASTITSATPEPSTLALLTVTLALVLCPFAFLRKQSLNTAFRRKLVTELNH